MEGDSKKLAPARASEECSEEEDSPDEEPETKVTSTDEPSSKDAETPAHAEMDPSTLTYEGDVCTYTDPATKYQYVWDKTKNEWVAKASASSYNYEGNTHTYTDPTDGTVYLWDTEKNAWFPKIDDDFLAQYQMNYGFTDPKVEAERAAKEAKEKEEKEKAATEAALKRKAPPKDPTWFELEEQHNTKVYVSNLPTDITETEFVDLMQKYGMVMRDEASNKMKVKLYTEPGDATRLKGDALCTYIKVESVDLALKLLDGTEYRGNKISVDRAKFQMKGSYDPNLKPKKKRRKDKEKMRKQQEALFDWRPEKMRGERSKHERTVIVKNLFEPALFEKDVALILEYQQDMREECAKCGTVRKVIVCDRHPEGIAQITFSEPEEADACILLLNGRWFGQRKISAETWDGKTKYKIMETEDEKKARLQTWNKFLETGEKAAETATADSSTANSSTADSATANSSTADSVTANSSTAADSATANNSAVNTSVVDSPPISNVTASNTIESAVEDSVEVDNGAVDSMITESSTSDGGDVDTDEEAPEQEDDEENTDDEGEGVET